MRVTGTTNFCPCCSGTKPGHLGYEADPTVTAVSELKPCPFCPCTVIYTHEPPWGGFATICTECGGEGPNKNSREEAEAAWNRRSALADVEECETCGGNGRVMGNMFDADRYDVRAPKCTETIPCPSCTGKQPRPAAATLATTGHLLMPSLVSPAAEEGQFASELRNIAEAKRFDREKFDDDSTFADWAQSRARHALLSPAAHTAQVTTIELPQGVKPVGEQRLREIMSGYADFPAPDYFETSSLAYEVRNWRMDALRRLAEQGSGATGSDK